MFDKAPSSPLLASDRSVYFAVYDCIVRGMCEAACELLNPNLCEGKFASAFLCTVKFDKEVGALRLHGDHRAAPRRGCATTPCPGGGARLAATKSSGGYAEFATPMPLRRTARGRGRRTRSVRRTCAVRLVVCHRRPRRERRCRRARFPQYGTSAKSALTHASAIHRTRGTEMHGGLAEASASIGAAEVAQWWMAFASEDYDRVLKQETVGLLSRSSRSGRASGGGGDGNTEPQPLEPLTKRVAVRQRPRPHPRGLHAPPAEGRDPSLDGDCGRVGGGDRSSREAYRGVARGEARHDPRRRRPTFNPEVE